MPDLVLGQRCEDHHLVDPVPELWRESPLQFTHHFRLYAPEKIPYAVDRYSNEAKRLYGVLDTRLKASEYVAGDEYTIADIAIFPWLRSWQNQGIDWDDFPYAKAWFDRIAARPAVQRGVEVLAGLRKPLRDDKAREVLFGAKQYQRH